MRGRLPYVQLLCCPYANLQRFHNVLNIYCKKKQIVRLFYCGGCNGEQANVLGLCDLVLTQGTLDG